MKIVCFDRKWLFRRWNAYTKSKCIDEWLKIVDTTISIFRVHEFHISHILHSTELQHIVSCILWRNEHLMLIQLIICADICNNYNFFQKSHEIWNCIEKSFFARTHCVRVEIRFEKARKAILFHQMIDFEQGHVEHLQVGPRQLIGRGTARVTVQVHLLGTLDGDKLGVDLFGLVSDVIFVRQRSELGHGQPKVDVLFAEFALQKCAEQCKAVFISDECFKWLGPRVHIIFGDARRRGRLVDWVLPRTRQEAQLLWQWR